MNGGTGTDRFSLDRERMVAEQLQKKGITDFKVLQAMREVPRHLFVDKALAPRAYGDHPLPIGNGQTISQPYMVALMTQCLGLQGGEKVLEIGTGSGYQAAILAQIARNVFTVERHAALAMKARRVWEGLGLHNIAMRIGDGTIGWSTFAPFDAIVVTAGSPEIPQPLMDQIEPEGGRLVIPVGASDFQQLKVITRRGTGFDARDDVGCTFVPLVGRHGWQSDRG
jgi:protein-L-isoaspartate(D-aspartate) O-methyltransferase